MLFAGLSSAYIIRSGGASDWRAISIPRFLIPNSLILLASSVTLEMFQEEAHRSVDASRRASWIGITTLLGTAFLAGQISIWKTLVGAGNLSEFEFPQLLFLSADRGARCAPNRWCHRRCWSWQEWPGVRFMQPAGFGFSQT